MDSSPLNPFRTRGARAPARSMEIMLVEVSW